MASRKIKKSNSGNKNSVLFGIALAAFGLLLLVAILLANQNQTGGNQHLLSLVGYELSHSVINFGLGKLWSLIFPLILLQIAWKMLMETSIGRYTGFWFRQLLLAFAAALSHAALILISDNRTVSDGGAWLVGTVPALLVSGLVSITAALGTWIIICALDLIVLAVVFKIYPQQIISLISRLVHKFIDVLLVWFREINRAISSKIRELKRKRKMATQLKAEKAELALREEQDKAEALRLRQEMAAGSTSDISPTPDNETQTVNPETADEQSGSGEEVFDITDETVERETRFKASRTKGGYHYKPPGVELLDNPPANEHHVSEEDMQEASQTLIACLKDFNVEAKVVHVNPGPVITRYDLEPAPGVKVSRIVGLSDDLAMNLCAERIRIIAPVPGKGTVGIEIPNKHRNLVFMKSIVNSEKFTKAKSPLTIALGKTSSGGTAVADLRSMPHILIAGQTGAGKSVCINSFICSILLRADPTDVQFVMIDPKMIELSDYGRIARHFIARMDGIDGDVITDPQDAVKVLSALEVEMDNRYRFISQTGYRGIEEFNNALKSGEVASRLEAGDLVLREVSESQPLPDKMVYLVVIIDELADLMMTAGKEIEISIARLAQKARAVGIHLVVATQRPSVDVLTGLIKANFPARIAFAVRQKVDSKTIIDSMGANQLLGKGDMLYLAAGSPDPVRLHNNYIGGKEIRRLLDHIRKQSLDFKKFVLPFTEKEKLTFVEEAAQRDELFWNAAEQVIRSGQGSISVLQRRLRIGHSRASRLIDELEIAGVVGEFDGSKARIVLADVDWLEENRDT
jgi:DNA segregation ATPase FtsK/SpoIIIE, S-DNA-T family